MKKLIAKLLAGLMTVSLLSGFNLGYNEKIVQAEEKERAMGLKETTKEEQKWFEENTEKITPKDENSRSSGVTLPKSVDNSTKNEATGKTYFPNIGDQQWLGSCGPFAVTYYQLSYMVNKKNNTDRSSKDFKVFSPKWIYNMVNNGEDKGTYSSDVLEALREVGAPTWNEFPYVGNSSNPKEYTEWCLDENVWKNASNYRIENEKSLYVNSYSNNTPVVSPNSENIEVVKSYLNDGYVLTFSTYFRGYSTGKVSTVPGDTTKAKYDGETIVTAIGDDGGHRMTIVGYDDDIWVDINGNKKADNGEYGAFKVANSWGSYWGNDGFIWFAYDSLNRVSSVENAPEKIGRYPAFRDGYATAFDIRDVKDTDTYARFTIEHNKRNDIDLIFKAADSKGVLEYIDLFDKSGSCSFDGSQNKSELTFVLNVGDYYTEYKQKYLVNVQDININNPMNIKNLEFLDSKGNIIYSCKDNLPESIDGIIKDYTFDKSENVLKRPTVTIDEFSVVGDGQYTVKFDGSQPDGRKVYYDLYENDTVIKSNRPQQASSGIGDFPFVWQKDGDYNYKLVIEDLNGNKRESDVVTVKVDNLKVPIVKLDELWAEKDGHAELNINGNQSNDNVVTYEVYENDKVISTGNMKGKENKTINLYNKRNGTYDYKIILKDKSGNKEESSVYKLVVNNGIGNKAEPTARVDKILSFNKGAIVDLYCGAVDPITSKVELYEDGKLLTTKEAGVDSILRFGHGGLADGYHDYKFILTDKDGKKYETNKVSVYITSAPQNTQKPTISSNVETSIDGKVSITIDASEISNKIKSIYLYENDNQVCGSEGMQKYTQDMGTKADGVYTYQAIVTFSDGSKVATDKVKVVVDRNAIPTWELSKEYKIGDKVIYNGSQYECTYAHTSQPNWAPSQTGALWKKIY